jgi:hypothetical protein
MPNINPLEAAERLEHLAYCIENKYLDLKCTVIGPKDIRALKESASMLRQIAAGEYKPVVHALCHTRFDGESRVV